MTSHRAARSFPSRSRAALVRLLSTAPSTAMLPHRGSNHFFGTIISTTMFCNFSPKVVTQGSTGLPIGLRETSPYVFRNTCYISMQSHR